MRWTRGLAKRLSAMFEGFSCLKSDGYPVDFDQSPGCDLFLGVLPGAREELQRKEARDR